MLAVAVLAAEVRAPAHFNLGHFARAGFLVALQIVDTHVPSAAWLVLLAASQGIDANVANAFQIAIAVVRWDGLGTALGTEDAAWLT